MTEIDSLGAGVVVAGCSWYGDNRIPHGVGGIGCGMHHDVDRRELRLRCARAADANVALAVHGHGGKDEIAIRGVYKTFLHQSPVANSDLVPENPWTRFRVAFGAIAPEHAAVANEGAVDTPTAAASPQFRPWLWLICLHRRRG